MSRIRDIIALAVSMCAVSLSIIACSGPLKPEEGSTVLARFSWMPEVVLPPQTQYNRSNPNYLQTRDACRELKAVRDNWYALFAFFDHPETRYSWDGQFHSSGSFRWSIGDSLAFISDEMGYGMVDSLYGGGRISKSDWCVLSFWSQWDAFGHGRLGYHSDQGGEGRW